MYKIENIGKNKFYLKVIGSFPPSVATKFAEEFLKLIEDLDTFSIIIDLLDEILIKIDSIDIILDLLKETGKKVERSAFLISNNPPLTEEAKYVLKLAKSDKRKIVSNLDEAKEWLGISDIVIKRD
ncbi:MAG: hypothetical protein GF317_19705 [Candidatus Lokiarchaeota archaeon]|nr:hypothetical protein [Candidatus Lokiarchaeota archaeon]MBD3201723.1 hypothetical protein [Candidatus Lokiarchaeota archaeon]